MSAIVCPVCGHINKCPACSGYICERCGDDLDDILLPARDVFSSETPSKGRNPMVKP